MTNAYDIVESLLPGSSTDDESEDEDTLRNAVVLLLRLEWAQTSVQLNNIERELELLFNAPSEEPKNPSEVQSTSDNTWRLDAPTQGSLTSKDGPLLDVNGKVSVSFSSTTVHILIKTTQPLRPFTILPAGAGERARLQAEVFRPDHRLPTMTIDQYLEEEQRRGNIISGGG